VDYVIGLGSNLGSRAQNLAAGLDALKTAPDCHVARVSPFYESEPLGPPQPGYLNAAARVWCAHSPRTLLGHLQTIETLMGRTRQRLWGPRTLDLDILWAEQRVQDDTLQIPHAQLRERWFALRPLLDVAPELTAEYGPRLCLLHPEPMRTVTPVAPPKLVERDGGLEVTVRAPDLAEALAQSLSALGSHLFDDSLQLRSTAHLVAANSAPGGEITAFCHALMNALRQGQRFARVTIDELVPGRVVGRLLSTPAAAHAPPPALRLGSADFQAGALRLCWLR
jgi:2-amino-4-hydroxy-6-hydroxymethyldihydropteridine diphosphokinase